ncbi:MAG: hypothetical protein AB8G99_04035 [Planctomycetaceae bacterium]
MKSLEREVTNGVGGFVLFSERSENLQLPDQNTLAPDGRRIVVASVFCTA